MNLTIERSTLLSALTKIGGIVSRKATIPILSHILITAHKDGRLIFRATNLDIEATVTTTADVHAEGSTCAPADVLLNIAKNSAAGAEIHFDLGARLVVKSGRSRFQVSVLSPDNFPTFADIDGGQAFTMTGAELDGLVGRVQFAAGVDMSRYILTGINFSCRDGELCAAATNVKRIAMSTLPFSAEPFNITLPGALVSEIRRMCAGDNQEIEFTVAQGKVRVDAGETVIIGKLLDGAYVTVVNGIPSETPNSLIVERDVLEASFRRVGVAIDDTARSCMLAISPGKISLSCRAIDIDAADEVECEYSGPSVDIGVNSKNVLEAMAACGTDRIEVRFNGNPHPIVIYPVGDESFFSVCSTLRA